LYFEEKEGRWGLYPPLQKIRGEMFSEQTPEEQVAELTSYLIQFKEELEFILANISVENLSQDLVNRLNDLGADIVKDTAEREEQINQLANKALTVSDVLNSSSFKSAVQGEIKTIKFSVNTNTGNLEYTTS
jgi:hypothetical protein